MSGSSGGFGGGVSANDEVIACDILRFETQIASPNPAIVSTLKIGDELLVSIASSSSTQEIQVFTDKGQLVGGLAAIKVQRLRECMLQNHAYKVKVLSVNSGQARVAVEHA